MGKELKTLRTHSSIGEWSVLVADCRDSDMTYSQYYRWQRKMYEAMQEPEVVEIDF